MVQVLHQPGPLGTPGGQVQLQQGQSEPVLLLRPEPAAGQYLDHYQRPAGQISLTPDGPDGSGSVFGPHTDAGHRDADQLLPDHVSVGGVWTPLPPQDHHGDTDGHRVVAAVLAPPEDAALTQTPGPAEDRGEPGLISIQTGRKQTDLSN